MANSSIFWFTLGYFLVLGIPSTNGETIDCTGLNSTTCSQYAIHLSTYCVTEQRFMECCPSCKQMSHTTDLTTRTATEKHSTLTSTKKITLSSRTTEETTPFSASSSLSSTKKDETTSSKKTKHSSLFSAPRLSSARDIQTITSPRTEQTALNSVSKNPTVRIVNDCLQAVRTVCVTWCPESRDGNKLIKPTASRTHGCKVSDQGQVREGTELEPKPITHLFASVNEYDIQSPNSEPNVQPNGNVYKSSQLKKGMLSIAEISCDEPHSSEGLFYAHLDFSNAHAKANCPLLPLAVTEYGDIDFRTNLPAINNETF